MKDMGWFTTKRTIVEYLFESDYGRRGKDYELLLSVVMASLAERQFPFEDVMIGFKPKDRLPPSDGSTQQVTGAEISQMLQDEIDEDDPVDFLIGFNGGGKMRAMEFQAKRFGLGQPEVSTLTLIQFLNSIKKKYGKVGGTLLIMIDPNNAEIDTKELMDGIDFDQYPFDEVVLTSMRNNKITLARVKPVDKVGAEEIDISEIIKKM